MESEFDLIEWIAQRAGGETLPRGILHSIGDDCAVIDRGAAPLAITKDVLAEKVDFRRSWMSPHFLGRKALAVNLSDLAAMGARPLCCLLALSVPAPLSGDFARRLVEGLIERGREFGCPLVGGDLSASDIVHVSVTAVGVCDAGPPVLRGGGRPGDAILVAGRLGLSRLGLGFLEEGGLTGLDRAEDRTWLRSRVADPFRLACLEAHLDPVPLLEAGRWLSERGLARAMIDVSDGLAADLTHLARACGASAELDSDRLQLLSEVCGETMELDWVLNGGEDFALLFAASPSRLDGMRAEWPPEFPPLHEIGRLKRGSPAVFLSGPAGRRRLRPRGFDHFR